MSLSTASQQGFLLDLPLAALHGILHKVGLCSRELCSALLDAYGPLPRLTPRGVETPEDLLSVLATHGNRHSQLSSLDLRHVACGLTDNTLIALCRALPNLNTLRLPKGGSGPCSLTAGAVAAATSQLPSLTALHVDRLLDPLAGRPIPEASAPHLQELGLPTPSLAAEHTTTALSHFTGLSKLCFCGGGEADVSRVAALAAHLPSLVALELNGMFQGVHALRSLTRLTALKLSGCPYDSGVTTGQQLQAVGTLTGLRSLDRQLWWHDEDAAEPGWLTGLALLTSLRANFGTAGGRCWRDELLAFEEVAASVPHLPALRELHVAASDVGGAELSAAACANIASARSSLRLLHLCGVSPPGSVLAAVLLQLTALTCLRLEFDECITSFRWLTALTALKEFWHGGENERSAPLPCQLLARLSDVRTLSLASCPFVRGPYLERLSVAMPQLTSLDMSDNWKVGTGLSALQHFTNLEELGLGGVEQSPEVLQHVRVPSSLTRCYLGGSGEPGPTAGQRARTTASLGRHVGAVLSDWKEVMHLGW